MGNDALFGRYWAADSFVHRLDPRTKLIGTIALVVIMFCAGNFWALRCAPSRRSLSSSC